MRKRILSWVMMFSMVFGLLPAVPVAAAQTSHEISNWPSDEDLKNDTLIVNINANISPSKAITVTKGKTVIVTGTGTITGTSINGQTIFTVEDGGHLVLDDVTINGNAVSENGAVYVKKGGLLDLGYNDKGSRHAPGISGNTYNSAAKNLVIEDGATVRLNAAAQKSIGVSYAGEIGETNPKIMIQGGRHTIKGDQDKQENLETNITTDSADEVLYYAYDCLVLHPKQAKVLVWYATDSAQWAYQGTNKTESDWRNILLYDSNKKTDKFASFAGAETTTIIGAKNNRKSFLTGNSSDFLDRFDFIYIVPGVTANTAAGSITGAVTVDEKTALLKYLDRGGRIFIQVEDSGWPYLNAAGSKLASELNTGFTITSTSIAGTTANNTTTNTTSPLVEGVPANWAVWYASKIDYTQRDGVTWLFKETKSNNVFGVDLVAGSAIDTVPWGNVTVLSDSNLWSNHTYNGVNDNNETKVGKPFLIALLKQTIKSRILATVGVNPNETFSDWQAKVVEKSVDYRTPAAALGKVVENETVLLLKDSGLTPATNELLFNGSTLKDTNGNTVKAVSDGVYIDVTASGAVNVHSGTVEVTPASGTTYTVMLGGEMNSAGDAFVAKKGIRIESGVAYTLNAADEDSPILPANNGTASITLKNQGDSVKVTYPDGEVVEYTASKDGDKIYLGTYRAFTDQVTNNAVEKSQTHLHHGYDYTLKYTPRTGYELDAGEFHLSYLDRHGAETVITLSETTPADGSHIIFSSDDGLVTVEQLFKGNGTDDAGTVIVTVRNVTSDIKVYTEGNAAQKVNPTITLRGVGKDKNGNDVTLYEYYTTYSYVDGVLEKTIKSIPWEKYALVGVKHGLATTNPDNTAGTESLEDGVLCDANGTVNADATQNVHYLINLPLGDQVVEFRYEWNWVEVKVKTETEDGSPLAVERTDDMEVGVEKEVAAPYIPGYSPVDATKPFTPSKNGPNEITFRYKKISDTVTYRAVDTAGNELGSFEGPQIVVGDTPDVSYTHAPKIPGYEVLQQAGVANPTGTYDGQNSITITFTYKQRTKDIGVYMYEYDPNATDHKGAELKFDTKTYAGMAPNQTLTITAPTIAGYSVKVETDNAALQDVKSIFIKDDNTAQNVEFFYVQDTQNAVTITVRSMDTSVTPNKEIGSYTIPALAGQAQLVLAPTWLGYKLKDSAASSKTIVPDAADPTKNEVVFEYEPDDPKTVTVKLVNNDGNAELQAPAEYQTSYTLKRGDSLKLQAPAINGYSLVSTDLNGTAQTTNGYVQLEHDNILADNTVTFSYFPVTQAEFVTHTVLFTDHTGQNPFYTYSTLIAKDDKKTTAYTADDVKYVIPGYKLVNITLQVTGETEVTKATQVDAPNNKDATILYKFDEDSAKIVIKKRAANGTDGLTIGSTPVEDTTLTGYRAGQKNIVVVAPLVENHALLSDLTYTISELQAGENEVIFRYASAGTVTFTLKERMEDGTERTIEVINGEATKDYDPGQDGNPLNLSKYGYTYTPDNSATEPFREGDDGKVTNLSLGTSKQYVVYYTKKTRAVDFIPVDKAKLDADNVTVETATTDELNAAKIDGLTITTPEPARVGETYTAVAQTFDGWVLSDQMSKHYEVKDDQENLKVYFCYKEKTTGTVTVHYHYGEDTTDHTQQGPLLVEYAVQAVVGEKVTVTAPEYLMDNKYKLRKNQTNPLTIPVVGGTAGNNIEFYYEANFVTVDVKTDLNDGKGAAEYEKHEVTKDVTTQKTGDLTLYPPYKAGYTLVGITATGGATLTNGGTEKLPDEYADGKLTLSGLTADTMVTYYYKPTSASEYQADLTVEYKYNSYDLAAAKTIKVNKGDNAAKIDLPTFDGYKATAYEFDGDANPTSITDAERTAGQISVAIAQDATALTLTITYARPDGSVVLPGADGEISAPKDEDNVIVTPDDPNNPPTINQGPDPKEGSVTIPTDTTGTVTRPDPTDPSKKEDVKVPEGTIVDPDGTIHLPDGGGTIAPDDKLPNTALKDYVTVTYEPNGGTGNTIKQLLKKNTAAKLLDGDVFTAPNNQTFDGWTDGNQTYTAGASIMPSTNMTLTAKWTGGGTPVGPTYRHNLEIVFVSGQDTKKQAASSNDLQFMVTLEQNTFQAPQNGWTFMGWTTSASGSKDGTFYPDQGTIALDVTKTDPTLYAIWYQQGNDGAITLPGEDLDPTKPDDNVTVNPGNGNPPTAKNGADGGYVEAGKDNTIDQPKSGGTITVVDGPVKVYPDGTVEVPDGSKVKDKDGNDVPGPAIIKPDGTTDKPNPNPDKPKQDKDGSIIIPGKDGKLDDPYDKDNVIVKPDNKGNPTGKIDNNGDVTITDPDGADVSIPGDNPPSSRKDIKVPEGSVISPDGTIRFRYIIKYVDQRGDELTKSTYVMVKDGAKEVVYAKNISGYTAKPQSVSIIGGDGRTIDDYTITFTYTKNSGGGTSGGGGGGSTTKPDTKPDPVEPTPTPEPEPDTPQSTVADPNVTGVSRWLNTITHDGYMGGYGDGKFGASDNMTRAQACQMFYNLLLNKDVEITVNFTDVADGAWYAKAVNTLASIGIIKGVGNGEFAPDRPISRAEFAAIASRFANPSNSGAVSFLDVSANDWYYSAVLTAVSYGWISGYEDGTFKPNANITRAEVTSITNRMLARAGDKDFIAKDAAALKQFSDVPVTHWAYHVIMEAVNGHEHTKTNGVEVWNGLMW